ncbi:MAG: UbiH/UbiF/VisC/COQ6 family ubiquinone biosynthesis hydroxylase [Rudaea sp.]|uniref:UbiH/UbiF/VisC/COQ6 family ubiquinone biosynthesis hydroxylase n=1 Tax=Rudaea sp. TaxID=2136325 RepID=UPI0039E23442
MSGRRLFDVAIVGAGMVGAALALDLAQRGFDVALVESRPPAPWRAEDEVDLRVVALAASSIALLQRLDVWTSIAASRASAYRRMQVWDALAPGSLGFDAADEGAAALGYIVENKLIQSALWRAIERQPAIRLHCPARVVATEVSTGAAIESRITNHESRLLTLDDGTQLKARLVVAADGDDSALRGLLGIATRDRDYAQRGIVAHVAHERAHEATAWQRFLPGATLAFLPLADGRSSIVWSVPNDEAERLLALDDVAFRTELGAAFDFRLGAITATTRRAAFPLRLRLAERYAAPRFALVGDAAHVVHPLAGQGVNLGFRDAVELANVLAEAKNRKVADSSHDFASEYTLRRYERRRRSDNAIAANAFDVIQRGFGSDVAAVAALRGVGLALVDRVAPLKRFFAHHAAG